jgi:hypothetical protein
VSEQLPIFDSTTFEERRPPRGRPPAGTEFAQIDNRRFVTFLGDGEEWLRFCGWYFGYPSCCVEAFIARRDQASANHHKTALGQWLSEPHHEDEQLPAEVLEEIRARPAMHPISGHVLCAECESGEPAPLPHRPARRLWLVRFREDGPMESPPSDYDRAEAP